MSANTQSLAMTKVYQILPTALHTANTSTYGTGKCVAHFKVLRVYNVRTSTSTQLSTSCKSNL